MAQQVEGTYGLLAEFDTPTELVNAIGYVLGNAAHHFGERSQERFASSALEHEDRERFLGRALGWLLRVGRHRANGPP